MNMREEFEAAVMARMMESGFLAIEVKVEMLGRDGEGYSDPSADAYWHYWQASRAALVVELPRKIGEGNTKIRQDRNKTIDKCREAINAAGVSTK